MFSLPLSSIPVSELFGCGQTLAPRSSSLLPSLLSVLLLSLFLLSTASLAFDDDEVHDEEILRAVIKSVREWSLRKLNHRVKRDEEVVCYGELGCFRDEGAFDYLDILPSSPEEIDTRFIVFTRKSDDVFSFFNYTLIGHSVFNSSNPTKIIIHGFGSTCSREWAYEMRAALLTVEDCNVICVDWENGASTPNYIRAAANTRLVGKQVAHLILWLKERLGSRTEDFHLIGFSLGAHVAAFTGQEVRNISRITGLDPAGPLFEGYDPGVRLDSTDANFVDVIHSNGESLIYGGLGSWQPMGHVDFYPNGGKIQKGCSNLILGAVRDFLWSASNGDGRSLCNHRRAYKFFTESVSPHCPFPAFSCESYEKFLTGACWDVNRSCNMGYYADRNPKKGLLYLVTRDEEPFCANQFRLTIESSPSAAPISSYGGLEVTLISKSHNESFSVTQTHKDNMVAGSVLQKMFVASPAINDPIKIQLKYTAYQGWLWSGISRWSMDRLILMSALGKSVSFCTRGLLLPSGIAVTVTLTPGICTNGFLPSSRPIYYPYENVLAPALSPEGNHLPENSSEVIDYSFPLEKQETNKTDVKIKICQLVEVNSTLECNEWNNTMPKYEAADPDVILPPQLQYILFQLDSQGYGPVNKSSKVVTRPTPLSRALKGRVVLLPGRKGRGFEFIQNVSQGGAAPGQLSGPAAHWEFIQQRGEENFARMHPPGVNNVNLGGGGGVQPGPIVHGVIHNNQLVRENSVLKNIHISLPLKEFGHKFQVTNYHGGNQEYLAKMTNAAHAGVPLLGSTFLKQTVQNVQLQQSMPLASVHSATPHMHNVPTPLQSHSVQSHPFHFHNGPPHPNIPPHPNNAHSPIPLNGQSVPGHPNPPPHPNSPSHPNNSPHSNAPPHPNNSPHPNILQQSGQSLPSPPQNIPVQLTNDGGGGGGGPMPQQPPPSSFVQPNVQSNQLQQYVQTNFQFVPGIPLQDAVGEPHAQNNSPQHALGQSVVNLESSSPGTSMTLQVQTQPPPVTDVSLQPNGSGPNLHGTIPMAQQQAIGPLVQGSAQTNVVGPVPNSVQQPPPPPPPPQQQQPQQQPQQQAQQQAQQHQSSVQNLQAHPPKELTQRSYTRRQYRKGHGVSSKGYYIVPFFRPVRRNSKVFYEERYRI